MIETKIQMYFLFEVEKIWKSLPEERRPWGIWIREYKDLPEDTDSIGISQIPVRVWFLDKKGFTPKEPSAYQRFIIVQFGKFWCKSIYRESSIVFGRTFEIGLSSFGNILGQKKEYYADFLFGGLFGRGYIYKFDDFDNQISSRNTWIS